MYKILNLGAGLQSSILLLLSDRGELPKLDIAIFSDTQYEPKAVYDHLQWLKSQVKNTPIIEVTAGNLRDDAIEFRTNRKSSDGKRYANIPYYIKNRDNTRGKARRQCTSEYKIRPIEKYIKKEILGLETNQRWPKEPVIEQWFGITADESRRMAYPGIYTNEIFAEEGSLLDDWKEQLKRRKWRPAKWRVNVYPFINSRLLSNRKNESHQYFSHTWTRQDCESWVSEHYPGKEFPKSACICCPYRNDQEWLRMKEESPEEWNDAVNFDYTIRAENVKAEVKRKKLVGTPFIHKSMIPLDMVEFNPHDKTAFSCGTLGDSLGSNCGT